MIKPVVDENLGLEGESNGFRLAPWRTGGETARFTVFSPLIRGAESDGSLTRPRPVSTKLVVEGIFRGQHFSKVTDVELHPMPDQWVVGPPPPESTARVAVRADADVVNRFGKGTGSIVIVLDCSGSMRFPAADGVSKFEHAKKAIVNVLERVVPRGTTVSLWTFSQVPESVKLINGEVPDNDLTRDLVHTQRKQFTPSGGPRAGNPTNPRTCSADLTPSCLTSIRPWFKPCGWLPIQTFVV